LEGKRLAAAGFERGVRFDLTLGTKRYGGLLLYLNEDGSGKRKVSGKGDRPIVDIVGAEIQRCGLQSGDDVVITYDCEVSEILIRRKENA